jgi:hypothetical protein
MKEEVNLIPFQILYTSNHSIDDASTTTDTTAVNQMRVLALTRQHLIDYEFVNHRGFITLTLYQTVRTTNVNASISTTTTLIAYTGTAMYSNDDENENNSAQQHLINQDMMYMCFFGSNGTIYVSSLQEQAGWTSLQSIELMTMTGNYVSMNENGTLTDSINGENGQNASNGNEGTTEETTTTPPVSSLMDNHLQTYIYLIAVCIPVGIVFLCGLCYIIYMLKYNVQWKWHNDPNDATTTRMNHHHHLHSIWVVQTNLHHHHPTPTPKKKRKHRKDHHNDSMHQLSDNHIRSKRTMDFSDINDPTNTTNIEDEDTGSNVDYCSDELTFDEEGMMDGNSKNSSCSHGGHDSKVRPSETFLPVIVAARTATSSSSSSSSFSANPRNMDDNDDDNGVKVPKQQKKRRTLSSTQLQPPTSTVRIVGTVEPPLSQDVEVVETFHNHQHSTKSIIYGNDVVDGMERHSSSIGSHKGRNATNPKRMISSVSTQTKPKQRNRRSSSKHLVEV